MKKTNIIISTLAMAFCLVGCGVKVEDMTDAQAELVTEYATQILLKHGSASNQNLLNDEKMKEEEAKEAEIRERNKKMQEAKEAFLQSDGEEQKENQNAESTDATAEANTEKEEEEYIENATAIMKVENFDLNYSDYNLCASYPEEKREDDFLSVDAKEGKQLLVLNFKVTNQLAEEQNLDLFSKAARFFLSVNGGAVIESSPTILMDDLSMFREDVAASESRELVLLFEVDAATQVETMELTIKCGDQKGTMKLQ